MISINSSLQRSPGECMFFFPAVHLCAVGVVLCNPGEKNQLVYLLLAITCPGQIICNDLNYFSSHCLPIQTSSDGVQF